MHIEKTELIGILAQFNPWWRNEPILDLPVWRRAAFNELQRWTVNPPAARAVLLSGPRQVGKTTLLLQLAQQLLQDGVPAANILYATFDHPMLKLSGIDAVIDAWREREPRQEGPEYLLLDEAQFIRDWERGSNTKSISIRAERSWRPGQLCLWSKQAKNQESAAGIRFV